MSLKQLHNFSCISVYITPVDGFEPKHVAVNKLLLMLCFDWYGRYTCDLITGTECLN
jgi:hypothetical protein